MSGCNKIFRNVIPELLSVMRRNQLRAVEGYIISLMPLCVCGALDNCAVTPFIAVPVVRPRPKSSRNKFNEIYCDCFIDE